LPDKLLEDLKILWVLRMLKDRHIGSADPAWLFGPNWTAPWSERVTITRPDMFECLYDLWPWERIAAEKGGDTSEAWRINSVHVSVWRGSFIVLDGYSHIYKDPSGALGALYGRLERGEGLAE